MSKALQPIPLDLTGCRFSRGGLYTPDDPAGLTDDMLLVCAGDVCIDVSWHPEHDPAGKYVVTVFRGEWQNQLHRHECRHAISVAMFVEQYVHRYAKGTA